MKMGDGESESRSLGVPDYNPITLEVEEGRSGIQVHP